MRSILHDLGCLQVFGSLPCGHHPMHTFQPQMLPLVIVSNPFGTACYNICPALQRRCHCLQPAYLNSVSLPTSWRFRDHWFLPRQIRQFLDCVHRPECSFVKVELFCNVRSDGSYYATFRGILEEIFSFNHPSRSFDESIEPLGFSVVKLAREVASCISNLAFKLEHASNSANDRNPYVKSCKFSICYKPYDRVCGHVRSKIRRICVRSTVPNKIFSNLKFDTMEFTICFTMGAIGSVFVEYIKSFSDAHLVFINICHKH